MFGREGGSLVFESSFRPILFNYNKNSTKLPTFNENGVSWYVLLFAYFMIEYMELDILCQLVETFLQLKYTSLCYHVQIQRKNKTTRNKQNKLEINK